MRRMVGPARTVNDFHMHSGDRMVQREFHELYENTSDEFKAELIGGIVYVASPVSPAHETVHRWLSAIFLTYQLSTSGLEVCANATLILAEDAEPQPDLMLRRLPEFGGRSITRPDGYIQGSPELVIEIANSVRSIDLHAKRVDYDRNGVLEYLVYVVEEQRLRWFDLYTRQERMPDADGIFRMKQFPGLWIDAAAIAASDRNQMIAVLQRGLSSPEHANFERQLSAAV